MTTREVVDRIAEEVAVIDPARYKVCSRIREFSPSVAATVRDPETWVMLAARAIAAQIYELHYLRRPKFVENETGNLSVIRLEDAELGKALRCANAGHGWVDEGWSCLNRDGNFWNVAKSGITLRARGEELDRNPIPGKPIGVRFPNALPYVSRGFYMAVADAGPVRTAARIQRIYVNVDKNSAVKALHELTKFFCSYSVRGQVKVVNHPSGYDRPDACTLYIERRDLKKLHNHLGALLGGMYLRPLVPGFCYCWMPGVGFAEEPCAQSGSASFGEDRARLIGIGIARAFISGRSTREGIGEVLDDVGIDPDRLYLNAGTSGVFLENEL